MKRVINWAHYKDNWADWCGFALSAVLEGIVSIVILVLVVYGFFACLLGYAPTAKEAEHDKS